ncbi:hypothetical protein [Frankia sp. AgB32]|uniref:hypothetical protein n=1 Tax=Frankia sp. AgB32 TaxID=631119 RepID=UPI00200CBFE1|nr:hypothetical protein [Frankia sp. AgB32]MCK9896275.1 hypothetical protein [Frankia sp. AgB32]
MAEMVVIPAAELLPGALDFSVEELEELESPGFWKVVGFVAGAGVTGGLIYGGVYIGTGVAIT